MSVELANTAAWLDLLYGKCTEDDGVLVFVSAKRNSVHSVHGFGSGSDLVAAANDVCGVPGIYLKINPMDYEAMRKRKRVVGGVDEVRTIVSFHLDVDAGKGGKYLSRGHALWAIDQMPLRPTLIINSNGDAGGFHVYWVLEKPERVTDSRFKSSVQESAMLWNKRLKELCAGKLDTTANLDRVLRVAGGKRKDGGPVSMYSYEPSRLYRIKDFVA